MSEKFQAMTQGGYDLYEVISALQKEIRRGNEENAMYWAMELTPKYANYLWSRMKVIANEDIGLADASIIILIQTLDQMRQQFEKAKKDGPVRLCLANAILSMCRAEKSRLADHFQCAIRGRRLKNPKMPIPDYALDKHTIRGKKMGRGWGHFFDTGTQLNDASDIQDDYKGEAEETWESGILKQEKPQGELFTNVEQAGSVTDEIAF